MIMLRTLACLILFIVQLCSGFVAERPILSHQRATLIGLRSSNMLVKRLTRKLSSSPKRESRYTHEYGISSAILFSKGYYSDPNDGASYSDDCFGLIFLTGLAIVQDKLFASTFLALSVVALLLTRFDKLPQESKLSVKRGVPAVVAGSTFVVATALHGLVVNDLQPLLEASTTTSPSPVSPILAELVVCSISILYAVLENKDPNDH